MLVEASPVVDYFAFMLENLAKFCTSSCLRETRQAGGPKTRRLAPNEEHVAVRFLWLASNLVQ